MIRSSTAILIEDLPAGSDAARVLGLEKRLDDVLGVHIRRYFYSDALVNSPELVRPLFSNGLPLWQRAAVTVGWSRIVPLMIKLTSLTAMSSLALPPADLAIDLDLDGDGRQLTVTALTPRGKQCLSILTTPAAD